MREIYKRNLGQNLEAKIVKSNDKREDCNFSKFATKSRDAIRRENHTGHDIRSAFFRDADRIIHSHAYARYIDKTQVFYLIDNDHITHRALHVQLVSKIARTVGRALSLNEDLIEAISLGHDIGHTPFGHLGESILNDLSSEHDLGCFLHNVQAVQFLDVIEDQNLTLQVLDGILCHNGENYQKSLEPELDRTWGDFDDSVQRLKDGQIKDLVPMTMEGCVVRFADVIAYIARDVQDAIEVGLIDSWDKLPETCKNTLGDSYNEIINSLVVDLIENSFEKQSISYSSKTHKALIELKDFNYKEIYRNEKLTKQEDKIKRLFECLFTTFLEDLNQNNQDSKIFECHLNLDWVNAEYKKLAPNEEKTRDFIAGMTDRFILNTYQELVFPKRAYDFKTNKNTLTKKTKSVSPHLFNNTAL